MKNLPVHWYEGLFLRPQHLQAADRHWSELGAVSLQWDHPYSYGLHQIEYSKEALSNYQFEVSTVRARMRDGTLVDLGPGNEPDRVDVREAVQVAAKLSTKLDEAFSKDALVRVYLAVPKIKLGSSNIASQLPDEPVRYSETRREIADENRGGKEHEIAFRQLNVRLLLSTDDLSGYELLPIAQIKRASEGEATPQLDESYIPPVLSIQTWPALGRNIVRAIYDVMGEKIDVLSRQVANRAMGLTTRDPTDVERISLLDKLNEAYGELSVASFASGIHPLLAYTLLARILGKLSILSNEKRVCDIPAYDHDDLARIFTFVHKKIVEIIHSVRPYEFEQRFFVGVGMGMQVTLEPHWFHSDWQWFIGVNKGELSEQECRELLSAGHLDWKLGSSRKVELLFTRRAEGLRLQTVDRPIRALPVQQDWIYYEVSQNESPAWRDVVETQTLAMRLRDSLILNQDKLQGEQRLLVSAFGRKVAMQFALFAVPGQR